MNIIQAPSPNHHGTLSPRYIMLHHTGSNSFAGDVAYMRKRTSGVSAHFVVGKAGEVAQLVSLNSRAWHAGLGGPYESIPRNSGNKYAIGIEIVNLGNNKDPFTEEQLTALDNLIAYIDAELGVKLPIIDHKTYAPKRKVDLRANFPMAAYQQNRAHKAPSKPKPYMLKRVLKLDEPMMKGTDVRRLQKDLKILADGVFGKATEKAVKGFQKSHKIKADGIVGAKTAEALGWRFVS